MPFKECVSCKKRVDLPPSHSLCRECFDKKRREEAPKTVLLSFEEQLALHDKAMKAVLPTALKIAEDVKKAGFVCSGDAVLEFVQKSGHSVFISQEKNARVKVIHEEKEG